MDEFLAESTDPRDRFLLSLLGRVMDLERDAAKADELTALAKRFDRTREAVLADLNLSMRHMHYEWVEYDETLHMTVQLTRKVEPDVLHQVMTDFVAAIGSTARGFPTEGWYKAFEPEESESFAMAVDVYMDGLAGYRYCPGLWASKLLGAFDHVAAGAARSVSTCACDNNAHEDGTVTALPAQQDDGGAFSAMLDRVQVFPST